MPARTRVELARESEAVDFELFVQELGLHAHRRGTIVEIRDTPSVVGNAVTAWLAEWHGPLVPTLRDGGMVLRPPAA